MTSPENQKSHKTVSSASAGEFTAPNEADTIAAPATVPGGALAIVRLSGPRAVAIADSLWSGRPLASMRPGSVAYGTLRDSRGEVLDRCVATVWRAPHSFTGEDSVELSLHGSQWIVREAMAALTSAGARPAEPGEFTRRAFMGGRLDLTQAEGVADLIASSSRAAHRMAMSQTGGAFSRMFTDLRAKLIEFASLIELELDFSEEEVEFADRTALLTLAREIRATVSQLADSYAAGRVLKEGVPVVIAGLPNAGKSTLLNLLLGDDRAIVSPVAGTTRDIIEDTAEIDGILYRFIDTAGIRHETEDLIEREGIERARARISRAAIVIWLTDPSESATEAESAALADIAATLTPDQTLIKVETKSDQTIPKKNSHNSQSSQISQNAHPAQPTPKISVKTGEGIPELLRTLKKAATKGHDPSTQLIVTNARHHKALTDAREALDRAIAAIEDGIAPDLAAQDIREATHHLGLLTGNVSTEDLLQSIFKNFCIGK